MDVLNGTVYRYKARETNNSAVMCVAAGSEAEPCIHWASVHLHLLHLLRMGLTTRLRLVGLKPGNHTWNRCMYMCMQVKARDQPWALSGASNVISLRQALSLRCGAWQLGQTGLTSESPRPFCFSFPTPERHVCTIMPTLLKWRSNSEPHAHTLSTSLRPKIPGIHYQR